MSTSLGTPGVNTGGIWSFPAGLKWPHDKYHQEELNEKSHKIKILTTENSSLKNYNARLKKNNLKLLEELKSLRAKMYNKTGRFDPRNYTVSVTY